MTTRTLMWFQKQTASDTVVINVRKTYDDGDTKGVDESLSDAALTARNDALTARVAALEAV